MTVKELSEGIREGKWTSADLVRKYLKCIAENDEKYNSIAEINANALFEARAMDEELKQSGMRSPLHGIPVLLKDNIDVKGMHTTAGSYALSDLMAEEDAFITKKLKDAGAVILGKTNLSEFAYFMSRQDMPSGYSSLNGQVIHPFTPGLDPSGSSTGSAVSVAAGLIPFSIGTETDGSLMSPSIANGIVSIKPTIGLVSRNGILPISHIQDTAGPMAACVEDIALVLQEIAGKDENDPATNTCDIKDYAQQLHTNCFGMKIGVFLKEETEEKRNAIQQAMDILKECDAEVIEIEMPETLLDETEALKHEFKYGLNLYLSNHRSQCKTLSDIIQFNRDHAERCLKYEQDLLEDSDCLSGTLKEKEYILKRLELEERSHALLDGIMDKYGLHCILSVGNRPQSNLSPISGNPCMCLPVGKPDTDHFNPFSYYLMAKAYDEDVLIHIAYTLQAKL